MQTITFTDKEFNTLRDRFGEMPTAEAVLAAVSGSEDEEVAILLDGLNFELSALDCDDFSTAELQRSLRVPIELRQGGR